MPTGHFYIFTAFYKHKMKIKHIFENRGLIRFWRFQDSVMNNLLLNNVFVYPIRLSDCVYN